MHTKKSGYMSGFAGNGWEFISRCFVQISFQEYCPLCNNAQVHSKSTKSVLFYRECSHDVTASAQLYNSVLVGRTLHVSLGCGRVGAPESYYVLPDKTSFVGKHEHALYEACSKTSLDALDTPVLNLMTHTKSHQYRFKRVTLNIWTISHVTPLKWVHS